MPKLRRIIVAILALLSYVHTTMAQELKYGVDFMTLFDNTEYAGMETQWSETLFSARLTPKVGLAWSEGSELVVASDFTRDFGHKTDFVSNTNLHFYYGYNAPQVRLLAGIFPRSEMRGLQSDLFFDRHYRYYNNTLSGVLARKEAASGASFIEFAMDYNGKRTATTREAFAIMTSARYAEKALYAGYDIMIGHYAKDYNPETIDGVVDNIMLTPYVEYAGVELWRMGGDFVRFNARLSYVQSLQRDRINENVWEYPFGGELLVNLAWSGLELSNRLYMGNGSLLTYYNRYGGEVYHGVPLYRTQKGIYDAIALSYKRWFFSRTVGLKAGITMEYDGTGWGTRQWLQVDVKLGHGIAIKRDKAIE